MKLLSLVAVLALLLITLVFSCSPDEEEVQVEEPPECYRCTYPQNISSSCDSLLVNEVCVIGPHENSLQMVLEIIEKCNGQITNTIERIRFLKDFLAEQQAAGAHCKAF